MGVGASVNGLAPGTSAVGCGNIRLQIEGNFGIGLQASEVGPRRPNSESLRSVTLGFASFPPDGTHFDGDVTPSDSPAFSGASIFSDFDKSPATIS
jgi:hypothetical protein